MDYIKLSRKILEWEWWHDINTCRVFIFLLIKANWKDSSWKGIEVKRGSYISSLDKMAADVDLTRNELRTAIKHLKSTKEINTQSTRKYTVFTVINYDLYQSDNTLINQQITKESHTINQLLTLREERKEYKNNNSCAPEPHDSISDELKKNFEIIYAIYPKKVGRTNAFENYKHWVSKKGKNIGGKYYHLTDRQIYMAVKKYVQQQEEEGHDDYQYWKNFDTLMGRQLLDYVEWEDEKK